MPYRRVISVGVPCVNRGVTYDVILTDKGLKVIKKRTKYDRNGQIILNVFTKKSENSCIKVKSRSSCATMKSAMQKRKIKKNEMDILSRMEQLSINHNRKRKAEGDEEAITKKFKVSP